MTEEKARELISALWRNNPSGASTFHECATEECHNGARDTYCVGCIVDMFNGENGDALRLLSAIKQVRHFEAKIVEACR